MAEAAVIDEGEARERTPIGLRLRWMYRRFRRAILPLPWAIEREMREHQRHYARARAEAQARNVSRNDMDALHAEEAHFFWMLEEELDMFASRRLIRLAKKYRVPIPARTRRRSDREDDPNWRAGSTFRPDDYLTDSAMYELRTKIRAERKSRYEEVRLWAPTVVALLAAIATWYGVMHAVKK